MLTPDQIDALRDKFELVTDPIKRYLITDIVRRIVEAGNVTRTGQYQAYIARLLGVTQTEVKQYLKELIKLQKGQIRDVYTRAATLTYNQTAQAAGVAAKALDDNRALQNIINAAVMLADNEFTNITQTMGFVNPYGLAMPYTDAYISCCDYALTLVASGAKDHYSAIREAVANISKYGVVVIDYDSGRHTSLDAAVRRNIMGGLGLMVEQVEQQAHDDIGANGWEISAHEASAPDHEPYQGKQYTDAQYARINGTKEIPGLLKRRIATLNCKHIAFPIIWGVSKPQYTPMQLAAMRERNAKGITYNGKHYTKYEATQKQREIERAIRKNRRDILVDEASGDKEALQTAQIREKALEAEYKRFSSAADLRTQPERLETLGYGPKQDKVAPLMEPVTVFDEYMNSATPGTGTVIIPEGYRLRKHRREIQTAGWIKDKFGGTIELLPESDVPGVKTPDFLWNGTRWEHKGASSINSIDQQVRAGVKQIGDYDGGLIVDFAGDEAISNSQIVQTINNRLARGEAKSQIDVIIKRGDNIVTILRHK